MDNVEPHFPAVFHKQWTLITLWNYQIKHRHSFCSSSYIQEHLTMGKERITSLCPEPSWALNQLSILNHPSILNCPSDLNVPQPWIALLTLTVPQPWAPSSLNYPSDLNCPLTMNHLSAVNHPSALNHFSSLNHHLSPKPYLSPEPSIHPEMSLSPEQSHRFEPPTLLSRYIKEA